MSTPVGKGGPVERAVIGRDWVQEIIRTAAQDSALTLDPVAYQMVMELGNAFADDLIRGAYAVTQARGGTGGEQGMQRSDLETFLATAWPDMEDIGDSLPKAPLVKPQTPMQTQVASAALAARAQAARK